MGEPLNACGGSHYANDYGNLTPSDAFYSSEMNFRPTCFFRYHLSCLIGPSKIYIYFFFIFYCYLFVAKTPPSIDSRSSLIFFFLFAFYWFWFPRGNRLWSARLATCNKFQSFLFIACSSQQYRIRYEVLLRYLPDRKVTSSVFPLLASWINKGYS